MKFLVLILLYIALFTFVLTNREKKQFLVGDLVPEDFFFKKIASEEDNTNSINTNNKAPTTEVKKNKILKLNEYIQTNRQQFSQLKSIINNEKDRCFNIFHLSNLLKYNVEFKENLQYMEQTLKNRRNLIYNDEFDNLLIYSFNEDFFDRTNFLKFYFVSKM